jgi:hypothetical protein
MTKRFTVADVASCDPAATELLKEYPLLGKKLLAHLRHADREIEPCRAIELRARREALFTDGADCAAARTLFDVNVLPVSPYANGAYLRTLNCELRRWWQGYFPPSEPLGIVSIGRVFA